MPLSLPDPAHGDLSQSYAAHSSARGLVGMSAKLSLCFIGEDKRTISQRRRFFVGAELLGNGRRNQKSICAMVMAASGP